MKKRWRSKNRKSASPSRSGQSTSPCPSGEPASPDRSGEGPSSAPAAPDREGGDERMQHRGSEGGDSPTSPAEETTVRPKRRRRKEKRRISPVSGQQSISSGVLRGSLAREESIMLQYHNEDLQVSGIYPISRVMAFERTQLLKKQRNKEKQREKERRGKGKILSGSCVQDDALVVEESSTALEQQHETSSLSPNHTLTFANLQDEGEASATPVSGKIKGKHIGREAGRKARESKISPSDSTQKNNVGDVTGNVQEAARTYASPLGEEERIKQNDDTILKEGCLDDEELLMNRSVLRASHSSSWSGDTQEEASFDGEETSLRIKMVEKLKPSCSGDRGIAQDEDDGRHSDKKPPSVVEDEQDYDKIVVNAIEERKGEQGRAPGYVQALLDMDDETIRNNICHFSKCLNSDSPELCDYCPEYEEEQLIELYEQLALYRIRAYELTVDRKLDELDDANLKLHYPPSKLYENGFFKCYEESLEWYFDPERCKNAYFDDYQRLVLRGYGEYLDRDFYLSTFNNTYEEDLAYVQYFEAVANKTKWIKDYMGDSTVQWDRVKAVASMQALEIAAAFPNVSKLLVSYGFKEYLCRIQSDYSHKGLDDLYFEIWKRVAKEKMDFKEALLEIQRKDMVPLRASDIKYELENASYRFPIKYFYDAHMAGIDEMASDDEARQLIREAAIEIASRPKHYLDYARKKLDIAKDIDLIPEGRRQGVAPQGKGDNGKAKLEMDD